MELLIFALIVLVVVVLLLWAVDQVPFPSAPSPNIAWIIKLVIIVIAALAILNRADIV